MSTDQANNPTNQTPHLLPEFPVQVALVVVAEKLGVIAEDRNCGRPRRDLIVKNVKGPKRRAESRVCGIENRCILHEIGISGSKIRLLVVGLRWYESALEYRIGRRYHHWHPQMLFKSWIAFISYAGQVSRPFAKLREQESYNRSAPLSPPARTAARLQKNRHEINPLLFPLSLCF